MFVHQKPIGVLVEHSIERARREQFRLDGMSRHRSQALRCKHEGAERKGRPLDSGMGALQRLSARAHA